jgi:hypothetical protein
MSKPLSGRIQIAGAVRCLSPPSQLTCFKPVPLIEGAAFEDLY